MVGMIPLILGILTIIIAVCSYGLYFRDMFRGATKPHGLTWLIWAVLNGLMWYQQVQLGAGPGAWVTAVAATANLLICISAFVYGERTITRFDWLCGGLALVAISAWLNNPQGITSTILACLVFIIGLIPTFMKSLRNAAEETAATFALNGLKFFIALFALQVFSPATALYPFVLFIVNGSFALFLVGRSLAVRRRVVS